MALSPTIAPRFRKAEEQRRLRLRATLRRARFDVEVRGQ
jgi:hypothetical protein